MSEMSDTTRTINGETLTLSAVLSMEAGAAFDAVVREVVFGDDLSIRHDKHLFDDLCTACKQFGYQYRTINPDDDDLRHDQEFFVNFEKDLAYPLDADTINGIEGAWIGREGKPYQAALEAAVAAYRRPAPPFSQDTLEGWWHAGELLKSLQKRGFAYRVENNTALIGVTRIERKRPYYCALGRTWLYMENGFDAEAETLPHAVARAAVAACWNETKEQAQ